MDEIVEQRPVAAADVEHAGGRRHHVGDELQIDADVAAPCRLVDDAVLSQLRRAHASPRCSAQPLRKPDRVAANSGSSSRKESWPLSLGISTKRTLAAHALHAWTPPRSPRGGK